MTWHRIASRGALAVAVIAPGAAAGEFSYQPPGTLTPGSGTGRYDETVYVPGMRFPVEEAPAFANSQVWGRGGSEGPGGGQCDAANFSYPWWDNYCESRSWEMPLCPSGTGHQGQDIRAATCSPDVHWAVAAEDGTISAIGSYSVSLMGESGTRHRYLHMATSSLQVAVGDRVARGQRLGRVSNEFGGTPTTVHLHYDLFQNVDGVGGVYVPTYMSLVRSYEELVGEAPGCEPLPSDGGTIDDGDPCLRFLGPAASWRVVTGAGHADDLRWTYAWDRPRSNWAEYTLLFEESGDYELETYLAPAWAQSQLARYEFALGDDSRRVVIDQSAADGWTSLGTFRMEAGATATLNVGDDTGEDYALRRQLVVDALRVRRVRPPEPVDAGGSDTGSDAGLDADTALGPDADAFTAPDADADPAMDASDTDDSGSVGDGADGPTDGEATAADAPTTDTAAGDDTGRLTDARTLPEPGVQVRAGCAAAGPIPLMPWALLALAPIARRRRSARAC